MSLVFGSKNVATNDKKMLELFDKYVEKVQVYPWGTRTEYINVDAPGICRFDNHNKIIIEMLGHVNAPLDKHKWIEHEATHELCHAFADLLPKTINSGKVIKNGIVRENKGGMIKETDAKTGELIGHHYYGKMFNETMMDIISSMAINSFAPGITNISVDDILQKRYSETGNQKTGYTFFTSITRLMVAAFSNVGYSNFRYQDLVYAGESMFKMENKLHDGTVVKANDFLYGIMFDPLHIEKEFDKYMGEDSYRILTESIDAFFVHYLKTGELSGEKVKLLMAYIPDFCNKKMADLERRQAITENERINMVGNFNRIWNSMQSEYNAYFSKSDIDEIINRARKY